MSDESDANIVLDHELPSETRREEGACFVDEKKKSGEAAAEEGGVDEGGVELEGGLDTTLVTDGEVGGVDDGRGGGRVGDEEREIIGGMMCMRDGGVWGGRGRGGGGGGGGGGLSEGRVECSRVVCAESGRGGGGGDGGSDGGSVRRRCDGRRRRERRERVRLRGRGVWVIEKQRIQHLLPKLHNRRPHRRLVESVSGEGAGEDVEET